MELRFCAYLYQHLPFPELERRWARAEALGFDVIWNVDTVVEPDRPGHPIFDGPITLAMMAVRTSTVRVGTLVSSLYFRSPITLAKAVVTVDHLSGGGSSSRSAWAIHRRARAPRASPGRPASASSASASSSISPTDSCGRM